MAIKCVCTRALTHTHTQPKNKSPKSPKSHLVCPSEEHHSRRFSSSPSVSVQMGSPFSWWVCVVRALLKTGIWRVEVGVCLGLEGSHLWGRIMCGLRAWGEILSTGFEHFRRDLFSTPNYLPELFNGDPISTACFLSFPIRTRERSKRPKTNILTLPETKISLSE